MVEQVVNCGPGTEAVNGICQVVQTATQESEEKGGGCLIATAAYGSEMAPQVQLLREIRDNQLMNTESGSAFMTGFNELYTIHSHHTLQTWNVKIQCLKKQSNLV